MQESGISPIDLTQAAIGPGISVYSRYASILEVDGSKMGVRSALEIINNELSKVLEETDYELDSGSKVCLKWFLVNGFSPAPYGDLDNLLRSTTSSSEIIEKSGCIVISNGKVRIAEIDSYAGSFSSKDMFEVPAWAHVHKLIRILNVSGEGEAAAYMRLIPSDQRDSVRSLTYRLYQICEEKKMIEQAKHYNSLAISWGQVSDRLLKPVVLTQVTLDEY
jgi:putative DNA methylase